MKVPIDRTKGVRQIAIKDSLQQRYIENRHLRGICRRECSVLQGVPIWTESLWDSYPLDTTFDWPVCPARRCISSCPVENTFPNRPLGGVDAACSITWTLPHLLFQSL